MKQSIIFLLFTKNFQIVLNKKNNIYDSFFSKEVTNTLTQSEAIGLIQDYLSNHAITKVKSINFVSVFHIEEEANYLFYGVTEESLKLSPEEIQMDTSKLYDLSFDKTETIIPYLKKITQIFHQPSLYTALEEHHKDTYFPNPNTRLFELEDFFLFEPCTYMFDNPGKKVRAGIFKTLSEYISIHPQDLKALTMCLEKLHSVSLIIDDIEDDSDLRRDKKCSHLVYGVPFSLNSSYHYIFKLVSSIPQLVRNHHDKTISLLVKGLSDCHKGQGQDILWRQYNYCPTEDEYIEMIRGKTSVPLILATRLFFLHSNDYRITLSNSGRKTWNILNNTKNYLCSFLYTLDEKKLCNTYWDSIEDTVVNLLDKIGVFYQIRDDYINLTDQDYWKKHGFCDDIHERKYSFPVVYMIQSRLGEYQKFIKLYQKENELDRKDIEYGLNIIQETGALEYTRNVLVELQTEIVQIIVQNKLGKMKGIIDALEIK